MRVSFANLNDDVYDDIGRAVRAVARGYYQAYQLATGSDRAATAGAPPPARSQSGEAGRPTRRASAQRAPAPKGGHVGWFGDALRQQP